MEPPYDFTPYDSTVDTLAIQLEQDELLTLTMTPKVVEVPLVLLLVIWFFSE
jgi:hypothetical protein